MDKIEREKLLEEALSRFEKIMALRSEFTISVAERVSFLLRLSVVGFGLMIAGFFFIILIMSTQMQHVTILITTMNQHFNSMNDDMDDMLRAMIEMNHHVTNLPLIVQSMDVMYHDMDAMSYHIENIHAGMAKIDRDMNTLSANVTSMKTSFHAMDHAVSNMGQDVRHMSSPMRMFNFFNPMR